MPTSLHCNSKQCRNRCMADHGTLDATPMLLAHCATVTTATLGYRQWHLYGRSRIEPSSHRRNHFRRAVALDFPGPSPPFALNFANTRNVLPPLLQQDNNQEFTVSQASGSQSADRSGNSCGRIRIPDRLGFDAAHNLPLQSTDSPSSSQLLQFVSL